MSLFLHPPWLGDQIPAVTWERWPAARLEDCWNHRSGAMCFLLLDATRQNRPDGFVVIDYCDGAVLLYSDPLDAVAEFINRFGDDEGDQ